MAHPMCDGDGYLAGTGSLVGYNAVSVLI
jgi:hypothetical protein